MKMASQVSSTACQFRLESFCTLLRDINSADISDGIGVWLEHIGFMDGFTASY